MATMAQLRYSPLPPHFQHSLSPHPRLHHIPTLLNNFLIPPSLSTTTPPLQLSSSPFLEPKYQTAFAAGGGGAGFTGQGGFGGGGNDGHDDSSSSSSGSGGGGFGPIGAFINGWRSRVAADPQFPFKVLMEELVGVTSCVLGDMASRPNFGLNELDFVFSTLVVGSILNFVLMYLLAPTASTASQSLPSIFASCPPSHMFQPGPYGVLSRLGTFFYKGTLFAAVGFAAGLVGTAISNGLIKIKKNMDPNFETPNKPPPTLLNAMTWAIHMGVSSNFRYQTLNGVEFLLEKGFPPFIFKSSVVVLRCLNNVLGGMSFVILARLTGSQAVEEPKLVVAETASTSAYRHEHEGLLAAEKDKLSSHGNNDSAPK